MFSDRKVKQMENEKMRQAVPVLYKEREHVEKANTSLTVAVQSLMQLSNWNTPRQTRLRGRLLEVQEELKELLR